MYSENVNDVERGIAVRMPTPDLNIVGYRVLTTCVLADGTEVEVQQMRNNKLSVKDEGLVLYREAEQLLGLCEYYQDQLMIATGGQRLAHQYLKSVAATLAGQGVFLDASTFVAKNVRAEEMEAKFVTLLKDADTKQRGFGMALVAGMERYTQLTGNQDPMVAMAMAEVIHASIVAFIKTHLQ